MEKTVKLVRIVFYLLVILLTLGFIFLFVKVERLGGVSDSLNEETTNEFFQAPFDFSLGGSCDKKCESEINQIVSEAISTISATVKPIYQSVPTTVKEKKASYIPLSGPVITTSTSWVDVAGTEVYIDLKNDYGEGAYVSWDAFLKVAHANGTAYARLFDVTHGMAVEGSELMVANIDVSTQVSSGQLALWAGRNLYRVQIKSLNSFEITFGSGRIKIVN